MKLNKTQKTILKALCTKERFNGKFTFTNDKSVFGFDYYATTQNLTIGAQAHKLAELFGECLEVHQKQWRLVVIIVKNRCEFYKKLDEFGGWDN